MVLSRLHASQRLWSDWALARSSWPSSPCGPRLRLRQRRKSLSLSVGTCAATSDRSRGDRGNRARSCRAFTGDSSEAMGKRRDRRWRIAADHSRASAVVRKPSSRAVRVVNNSRSIPPARRRRPEPGDTACSAHGREVPFRRRVVQKCEVLSILARCVKPRCRTSSESHARQPLSSVS